MSLVVITALNNCLIFEKKTRFFVCILAKGRQTDIQTDKQMDNPNA